MTGYSVKIVDASKELTKKERVMLKDTGDALKLDEIIQGEPIIINPDYWVKLTVHNEKSDNVDYPVYLIVSTLLPRNPPDPVSSRFRTQQHDETRFETYHTLKYPTQVRPLGHDCLDLRRNLRSEPASFS